MAAALTACCHRQLRYRLSPSLTGSSSLWNFARNFGTEQSTGGEIPAAASNNDAAAAKDASEGEGMEPAAARGMADVDGTVIEDPKIAQLESQIKDLKDNLLRSLAEQENTRRIAARDVANAKSFSIASFAKSLLDTSDNLSRALDAVPPDMRVDRDNHPILANLYQGISMTDAGLNSAFERNGLTKFGSRGEKFDPNMHDALFEYPNETGGVAPGHIGQVMSQKRPHMCPGAQVVRFEQRWILPTRNRIVGAVNHKTIGIPMGDIGHVAVSVMYLEWVRWVPACQLTVGGQHNLVAPRSLAMVDDGRLAVVRDKAGAAEHAVPRKGRLQRGGMPCPME
jgi:molecular chaperone GrpE